MQFDNALSLNVCRFRAERFASRVIDGEEYLYDACTYILLNPVKAGLCDRVEDWPWSRSRYGLDWS